MSPTLGPKETKVLGEIASLLYEWLPGSAPPFGRTYTFADAARETGLAGYWPGGSKLPAIQTLMEAAYQRASLSTLIPQVLREAIKYRDKKGSPLLREEVEELDALLQELGLRVPELSDAEFLRLLPSSQEPTRARATETLRRGRLADLKRKYDLLDTNPDLQGRGYELQDLLRELFDLFQLQPHRPFRVVGEQIDGSFVLDAEVYLLEARWRSRLADKEALSAFSDKVERKSEWTRGLFLSISGFSDAALRAMRVGKAANFAVMSGRELQRVLSGSIELDTLLREKVRRLAERGEF